MKIHRTAFFFVATIASCGPSPSGTDAMVAMDAIDSDVVDVVASPDATDGSRPAARGLFVPVALNANGMTNAMRALAMPDIDGIAVDIVWTDIAATAPRSYDFTRLDAMLQLAQRANKGVELSVIGAGGTPSWFAPATVVHLQYTPHNGATNRCYDTFTPPIWDAEYLAAWDDMTAQLANHLASAGFADTVVALRLTGLNASTAESHLPAQSPASLAHPPACLTIDNVGVWHAAGYTPSNMERAWTSMVESWASHFPTSLFEFVTWGDAGARFPPIDDSGNVLATPSAAIDQAAYDAVVAAAASRLGSRLIIGRWFLMSGMQVDGVTVAYANRYGTGTTWQTNLWWSAYENLVHGSVPGAAACGGSLQSPVQCTDATFLDELNTGVHPAGLTVPLPDGATRVIEVFMPDPMLYPTATHSVHVALTQ